MLLFMRLSKGIHQIYEDVMGHSLINLRQPMIFLVLNMISMMKTFHVKYKKQYRLFINVSRETSWKKITKSIDHSGVLINREEVVE